MFVVGPYFFKGGSIVTEFFVGFLICTVIALIVAIVVGLIYIRNLESEIKELREENDKLKRGVIKVSRSYYPGGTNEK